MPTASNVVWMKDIQSNKLLTLLIISNSRKWLFWEELMSTALSQQIHLWKSNTILYNLIPNLNRFSNISLIISSDLNLLRSSLLKRLFPVLLGGNEFDRFRFDDTIKITIHVAHRRAIKTIINTSFFWGESNQNGRFVPFPAAWSSADPIPFFGW